MIPFDRARIRALALAIAVMASAQAPAAEPPTLDALLKPSHHDIVTISPGGEYIAATFRQTINRKDRVMMAIIDRQNLKPLRILDPEEDGEIDAVNWVSPNRIFVRNAYRGEVVQGLYRDPAIIALNADGSRKRVFYAYIVSTLPHDDDHILVDRCAKQLIDGCERFVQKFDTDGVRQGGKIVEGPALNVDFMADNQGRVRFAYSWEEDDRQRLWVLLDDGKTWKPINDENESGLEVLPIDIAPDGSHAYLISERAKGANAIERYDFATGTRTEVMRDPAENPRHYVWSADGLGLIGAAYGQGRPKARFFDDNHPDAKLVRQLEAAFPDDSVWVSSGTRDGRYAVATVASDRDPGSFYLFDREKKALSLIARSKAWLSPDALAPTRAISFTASDGLPLHGLLTLPLKRGAQPPPLVVMPHGGPYEIRDAWGYDTETQILAAHGYAVLRVNFRGSGGYGRDFVEAGFRQWGRRMQDDLTEATRWAAREAGIDDKRICLWGASYGGYAALMGVVREPALYRCTIAASAVTDLRISWKWGDIRRRESGRIYLERVLGKDPQELYEYSPTKHAGKIDVPVLLVHGQLDDRVPFEHFKAMNKALSAAGKPPRTVVYGDETHGVDGKDNRREYYIEVLNFLAEHLGGAKPRLE